MHPDAATGNGGLNLTDHDGEIIKAFKDVVGKITSAAARGQLLDMLSIPTPAFIHYKGSQLNMMQ